MAKKQVIEEIKQGAPEYMNTYGDMMTLLLCFFVLLFSMSNVDAKKFEALVVSFSGSLGVLDGGNTLTDKNIINRGNISNGSTSEVIELEGLKQAEEKIKEYIKQNKLEEQLSVSNEEEGLLLRFQDNLLFDQGSAQLKGKALTVLKYVASLLNSPNLKTKHISVEGHTDNVPIKNSIYDSNWELSGNRASNVVRYLVEKQGITPKRLSAAGYSEYHPVVENTSPTNMARNRRVDIMIMRTKHEKKVR